MNLEKKKIKKTDLSITILILIGIIVVVNFFSYQIFFRMDLTQGKNYSISKASKKTVKNLPDIVNIKAYFSDNLPNQFISIRQEVKDILDEYRVFSNGKINIKFISPKDDEETMRELYMEGIPQLTFQVYEKDNLQLVKGYMGITINYGGKTETIPAIQQTNDLEYQITTAIKKVSSDDIAVVGFLTSNGTASLENNIKTVYKELQKLYSIQSVEFTDDNNEIPENIDTLIIVGPKEEFSDEQLSSINSFIARGGSLIVLLDGVNIENGLQAIKNTTNFNVLLEKYGITVNKDLVADKRNSMASFTKGFFTFSQNYPFWPKIDKNGFDQNNISVANLENVVFPWVSSINIDENKIEPKNISYLAFTTDKAWSITDNYNISPESITQSQSGNKKYNLAVAINGGLSDAYSDSEEKLKGKIIVVGDSDFIQDGFLRNNPDNLNFFQNLVDSLSLDDDLINIRSKEITSRPIKELSDSAKIAIRYINVFGITFLVIIFGMIRYYSRRKKSFVDGL